MTMARAKREEQAKAIEYLRESLKPGDTLFTILRHRAPSGMSRAIDVVQVTGETYRGRPTVLRHTWNVCKATDTRYSQAREAALVQGCGMDMGRALVYNIAATLWPDGFGCVGENCPSNDHSNGDWDYTPSAEMTFEGKTAQTHWHRNGGYALRQQWL